MNTLDFILDKYELGDDGTSARIIEIPNVDRNDLAAIFNELGFKSGVEVGVEHGYYSEVLCKANPQATIYGIDPWESLDVCKDNPLERRTQNHSPQRRCNRIFEEAKIRLSAYPNYKIIKKYSIDAINNFTDNSLDFVYIDANHEYSCVMKDLDIWGKKIRPGGIMSGHDYYDIVQEVQDNTRRLQVEKAVDDYVAGCNIIPLIIWGAHDYASGVKRDKWRSWMFIKP